MTGERKKIELKRGASLSEYQTYIHELERMHGWLDVDLVHNCFLMGEEMGELFKAIRKVERLFDEKPASKSAHDNTADDVNKIAAPEDARDSPAVKALVEDAGDEIVDVMNYLLAIANRLDIDVEDAFRRKNARNQERTWS